MSTSPTTDERAFPTAQTTGWLRRRADLNGRVNDAIQRSRVLCGPELDIEEIDAAQARHAAEVVAMLSWLMVEELRSRRPAATATSRMCALVCDLQQLAVELRAFDMESRTRRIASVEAGLARLNALSNTADLLDRVCLELARCGDFGRTLLSRVEDGMWQPWVAHFAVEMPEWFDAWLDTRIPLNDLTLETQILTERRPALVDDTQATPGVHRIVHHGESTSYVVAPVMPGGKVVGLFHADHHPTSRRADATDREVLWAFAEGFGHIYERTVMVERLRAQRDEVREILESVDSTLRRVCEAEMELAARPSHACPRSPEAGVALVGTAPRSGLDELTPREFEVLELMVAGERNADIAERLIIAEGTVKSHVKRILRKLGAANRSQAIAHYLGVTQDDL